MYKTLEEIKQIVIEMGETIDTLEMLYPTYGATADHARPHIEIHASGVCEGYNYVVVERGKEIKRNITKDLHELLYLIFYNITFNMAVDYSKNNRVKDQDFRRLMWKQQLIMLGNLDPLFAEKCQKEIDEILKRSPYNDNLDV